MQRKMHMQDQVGANNVEEIMTHFNRCSLELWALKFIVVLAFLGLGVYSKFFV